MVCASLSRQERQSEQCPYRGDDIIWTDLFILREPRRENSLKSGFSSQNQVISQWGIIDTYHMVQIYVYTIIIDLLFLRQALMQFRLASHSLCRCILIRASQNWEENCSTDWRIVFLKADMKARRGGTCLPPLHLGGRGRRPLLVQGQDGLCKEFQVSQGYIVKPCLKKTVCGGLVVGKRDPGCSSAGRALANPQGLGLNPGTARARDIALSQSHTLKC